MDSNKLEKLKKLLEVANDGLSKAQFLESFKKVVDQVLKIETKVLENINKAIDELKISQNASLEATQGDLMGLGARLTELVNKALKEQENGLNFIRDKVRKIKEGKDGYTPKKGVDYFDGQAGKDADEEKIISEILKQIKIPEIDKSELEELKKELETLKGQRRLGGGGGFSKIHLESKFIDDETPVGTVNGVNTIFILANMPNPSASVKVFTNGARMRITEDYTLSGRTITFVTAPPTGSIILCDYRQ
jgi:hypothetical protein